MIRYLLLGTALFGFLSAYANETDADAAACNPPSGWVSVADRASGKLLIIGEIHGTNEIVNTFVSYVCAVASRGEKVVVGLEIDEGHADTIALAARSDAPRDVLLEGMPAHWSQLDGRGSEAMLNAMVDLMALPSVSIVPFGRFEPLTPPEHVTTSEQATDWVKSLEPEFIQQKGENGMAAALIEASSGSETVIALVGSFHASKTRHQRLPNVDMMAMLLPDDPLTLIAEFDAGTAWNDSIVDGPGARPLPSNRKGTPEGVTTPAMGFSDATLPQYDGYFYVGPITASLPVMQDELDRN